MKKKILITVAAGVILLVVYILIFGFSAENATESSSRSKEIAKACVETVNTVGKKNWTQAKKEQLTETYENPIRKLAHFSEYALTGLLLFIIWVQWFPVNKKMFICLLAWICLTASADEIHQLFVDGRSGNVKDVLIDTAGGFFGILFSMAVRRVIEKIGSTRLLKKKII